MDKEEEHDFYLLKCLVLAGLAKQNGESPVGCVIVRNGHVVAEGIEGVKANKDITCHAEIEAIREVTTYLQTSDLSDCRLYTTHEPCIMCSYVIRHHRINTVVFGLATGEIGGFSSAPSWTVLN